MAQKTCTYNILLVKQCKARESRETIPSSEWAFSSNGSLGLRFGTHESVGNRLLSPLPEAVELDGSDARLGAGVDKNLYHYQRGGWQGTQRERVATEQHTRERQREQERDRNELRTKKSDII